jgi:hypothetical protein
MALDSSEAINEVSKLNEKDMFKITAPIDGGAEHIFYHTLKEGLICLTNEKVGIKVEMQYNVNDFPYIVEWKSMVSGDYALGIEPALSRFDRFQMQTLKVGEQKTYKIDISFE